MTDNKKSLATKTVDRSLDEIENRVTLNAFAWVDAEGARQRARTLDAKDGNNLPLYGDVIAVKDNIHVAGLPNAAGTDALRDFIPKTSASIVSLVEKAGAIVIGKAGMHELALGITSNNFAFGPVRNPINEEYIPGGSSGGSAASVAAGLVDVAIGTDTGGSIRLPAALTGTVGFRPTTGRYPNDGVTTLSETRDTVGFLTRDVADMIRYDRVVSGRTVNIEPADLFGLRIGVPRGYFYKNLDPDVAKATDRLLADLESRGVVLIEADVGDALNLVSETGMRIVVFEMALSLRAYLKKNAPSVSPEQLLAEVKSPDVAPVVTAAFEGVISPSEYEAALQEQCGAIISAFETYFVKHQIDAIIFPTSPITARPIKGILDGVQIDGSDGMQDTFSTYIRNAEPATLAGLPGISIPMGRDTFGLPIAVELDGPPQSDERILAIALSVEQVAKNYRSR